MSNFPRLTPEERNYRMAETLVTLGARISADIFLIVKHSRLDSLKSVLVSKKARGRIIWLLEKIINMQLHYWYTLDQWEEILRTATEDILKKDSEDSTTLIRTYRDASSNTKVQFAQKFMEIIWNVPVQYLNKPFSP